jgi:hypothetical protein
LAALDVERIERNVRGGDENLFDEGVHSLEHGEIEHFGALLVEIGHQFSGLRHTLPAQGKTLNLIFLFFLDFPFDSLSRESYWRERKRVAREFLWRRT